MNWLTALFTTKRKKVIKRPRHKFSILQKKQIIHDYKVNKMKQWQIAEKNGCSQAYISVIIKKHNASN